jgi:hypothetical protein
MRKTRPVKVGQRVRIKPNAGIYATIGTIREFVGDQYVIDAYDDEGRWSEAWLYRTQFTLAR